MNTPLVRSTSEWTFERLVPIYEKIEEIGLDLGYQIYPNRIEIITSEQMLDAYASIGMPIYYKHWSFGKEFLRNKKSYDSGLSGLAYEIVINSNPCINYLMENNTEAMQALVLAHAGIGHNHFFKNNYLFREWTDASGIIEYLEMAQKFVFDCEEKYGPENVEKILDYAHSIMNQSCFRYPRKGDLSPKKLRELKIQKALDEEKEYNDIWTTLPKKIEKTPEETELSFRQKFFNLPEENLLYFLETKAPKLKPWERQILKIVRNIAQYFYPQIQTKVMNEGCATYTHYKIINMMYDQGLIEEGAMLELLKSHSGVVMQPDHDDPRYNGINPYALGFAMMQDIERICVSPTEEDKKFFDFAGNQRPMETLFYAWENFRDESFIRQFLSPTIMRKFRFFGISNHNTENFRVKVIHDDVYFKELRNILADGYDISNNSPEIEVIDVNLEGDRELKLRYVLNHDRVLDEEEAKLCVQNIAELWGYDVRLTTYKVDKTEVVTSFYKRPTSRVLKEMDESFFY